MGKESRFAQFLAEDDPAEPSAAHGGDKFAKLGMKFAAASFSALGTPSAMVAVVIADRRRRYGDTFVLPSETLRLYGVDRHMKTRALRRLEAAGVIRVTPRGGNKAPLVTVLKPTNR